MSLVGRKVTQLEKYKTERNKHNGMLHVRYVTAFYL